MYDGYSQPLFTRLFVLYLFCVGVLLLVRVVQIVLMMRKARKAQVSADKIGVSYELLYDKIRSKAHSLRGFAVLTFLLSMLDLTWSASDILLGLRTMKAANYTFVLARMGDSLVPVSFGLIICVALYLSDMVCESALKGRQLALQWNPKSDCGEN